MGKMPKKPDPHPDAVLRVAIFGNEENLCKLIDRLQIVQNQGLQPDWALVSSLAKMLCMAWSSNITAIHSHGVISDKELETMLSRISERLIICKDMAEKARVG